MTQATQLQTDLPCARCGYDLRGLTPPGACPECGHDLEASIRAAWLAPPPVQARWLKHAIEGVWCVLGAFALAAIVGAQTGSRGQWIAAVTGLVSWAVTLLGCWKLARLETLEQESRAAVGVARTLRIVSATSVLVAIVGLTRALRSSPILLVIVAVTIVTNVAFYLRVRQIALRLGAVGLAGQALIVAALSASMVFAVAKMWGSTPLGFFSVTGWSGFARYVVDSRAWRDLDGFWRLISWPVVMTACQVAVLVQLLVALRRARGRAVMTGQ